MLRWQVQRNVAVIPKSVIAIELEDNLGIFDWELGNDDMETINNINSGERKIIPVITMENGIVKIRDEEDINYPFAFVEE